MTLSKHIAQLRHDFKMKELTEQSVSDNPITQFNAWLQEALDAEVPEAIAFVLATVNAEHKPTSRVLYIRGAEASGLSFFTNYDSRKGHDLAINPHASMTFFWPALERQIRVEGIVKKLPEAESDAYFNARPYESQLGAWASKQSHVIPNRAFLEEEVQRYKALYPNEVPRPANWGGYLLIPHHFEFWQGRPSRLHDRISYQQHISNDWQISRLSP